MENLPDLQCYHPFDEHGDYLHTHEIQTNLHRLENEYNSNNMVINKYDVLSKISRHELSNSLSNIQSLQP